MMMMGVTCGVALTTTAVYYLAARLHARKSSPSPRRYTKASRTSIVRRPLSECAKLQNDLVLRAACGKPTPRVPVWCMRQAGRHLPEFRALRQEGYDFFTMCQVPALAVNVSLQPLRRYQVDAVIIFSDILVVPQAMGLSVDMVPGKGPVFPHPLQTPCELHRVNMHPDIEETLGYVLDALNLARQEINGQVPLIGFCGGPFTLMTYMIEGGASKTKALVKAWLYKHPVESHQLLQGLTDVCVQFLVAQHAAGAQLLQVFETVGAEWLTQKHFYEYAFPYLAQIATRVKEAVPSVPMIVFSKGTDYAYEKLAETQYDCLGVDWKSDPADVRRRIGSKKALQGNMDPCAIYAEPAIIQAEVHDMLEQFGTQGYIANLGHGCFPDMDPTNVDTFIKTVQHRSLEMNNA